MVQLGQTGPRIQVHVEWLSVVCVYLSVMLKAKTSHRHHTAGKIDCNTESSYKKFQACLITYNKVVRVFVSMPWGY